MREHLKAGEEVSFPGLLDIKLIVESVQGRMVHCKYFDDFLRKYIRVTFPIDNLVRTTSASTRTIPATTTPSGTPTSVRAPAAAAQPDPANDIY